MNKFVLRSFAGGEITPELGGRIDLSKYQTGLRLARNFITLPHGPVARRPGFRYVLEAMDSTRSVRLIPFQFSADQSAILEFGHQYIRVHIDGGTLLETAVAIASIAYSTVSTTGSHGYSTGDWVYIGGRYHIVTVVDADTFTTADLWGAATTASGSTAARVYTLSSPYGESDLFALTYAQDADVIVITHPSYAVRELSRVSATSWTLDEVTFAPPSDAPTGVSVTETVAQNQYLSPQSYVVTAVQADGVTESLPSGAVEASNNLTLAGNYNTITWSGVEGSSRYNVYKLRGGVYGYIGQVRPDTTAGIALVSITRATAGYYITLVSGSAHGFSVSDLIYVSDTGVPSLDGTYTVTYTGTATTLTAIGTYGGIASAAAGTVSDGSALSVKDDNVTADTTSPPPDDIISLNVESDDYPACVTYHEQRRWFAGTNGGPQVLWATRVGTDSNLTSSIPARDADAMEIRIAATQYNRIRHLVALSDLIALTAGGEFRVFSDGAPAITPTSVSIKPQGYSGASSVQPVVTAGSILFTQAQGSRIRELTYSWESAAYKTLDVTLLAPHRINGYTITQLAYSRAPDQLLWAVRNDGVLLGMSYVPEQQVYGWHAHDTDGYIESVAVVAESNEDALYAVIRRTVDGRSVRYIERMASRMFSAIDHAFFVDAGLTYDGAPASAIHGLWHLEGAEVDILADGAVATRQTVTGGSITLDTAASVVHVGLPMTSDMQTLPLVMEGSVAAGQGTTKAINRVHLRVSQSSLVQAGPSFSRLRSYPARSVSDAYGSPPALRDGELSLSIDPGWSMDASVCVRQDAPLPLTVLSMTLEVQSGG